MNRLVNLSIDNKFLSSGLLSHDPEETTKRLLKWKEGFDFFYEKGTRKNAGYLILSKVDSKKNIPSIEVWDLNQQEQLHTYAMNIPELRNKYNVPIDGDKVLRFWNPILLKDGSIVVTHTGGGATIGDKNVLSPLIKFNACGDYEKHNQEFFFHHSLQLDKNENIYAPIYRPRKDIPKTKYLDDGIAILDKNLNVMNTLSLHNIFMQNEMKNLIDNNIIDPYHLNDAEPYLDNNDETNILLSLRNPSLLMSVNLNTKLPNWYLKNITSRQHDISFVRKKNDTLTISIFDNNHKKNPRFSGELKQKVRNKFLLVSGLPLKSNKRIFSPAFPSTMDGIKIEEYSFSKLKEELQPRSATQGVGSFNKKENSIIIESTNHGRIFAVNLNDDKILWQYINKTKNKQTPLMMSWSRHLESLPANYKKIINKSCINKKVSQN